MIQDINSLKGENIPVAQAVGQEQKPDCGLSLGDQPVVGSVQLHAPVLETLQCSAPESDPARSQNDKEKAGKRPLEGITFVY